MDWLADLHRERCRHVWLELGSTYSRHGLQPRCFVWMAQSQDSHLLNRVHCLIVA